MELAEWDQVNTGNRNYMRPQAARLGEAITRREPANQTLSHKPGLM
jgi:hypothetical protein